MDRQIEADQNLKEKFPRSEEIEKGSDGWLSPNGDYYKVGSAQHNESAEYLVLNSREVKNEEQERFKYPPERKDYDQKNGREKLKELGWILIRGNVLRSDDALNFTTPQLAAISKAEIKVVSVFDGSKEYSSDETQKILKKIILDFDQSEIVQQAYKDSMNGEFSPWFAGLRGRTAKTLNKFLQDPFHTTIYTAEVYDWHHPGNHEILPTEIFDIMSQKFSEEIKASQNRSEFTFRVLNLEFGEKIWVQREEYFHDGRSQGLYGDVNNYISIYVIDDTRINEKLLKIFGNSADQHKEPVKIISQVDGGYFEKYFRTVLK